MSTAIKTTFCVRFSDRITFRLASLTFVWQMENLIIRGLQWRFWCLYWCCIDVCIDVWCCILTFVIFVVALHKNVCLLACSWLHGRTPQYCHCMHSSWWPNLLVVADACGCEFQCVLPFGCILLAEKRCFAKHNKFIKRPAKSIGMHSAR